MGDPVSESAHYLTVVPRGETDLFLVQQGRLEQPGLVQVIRSRRMGEQLKRLEAAMRRVLTGSSGRP